MKIHSGISAVVLTCILFSVSSCSKDNNSSTPPNNDVVTKNGIAMNGDQEVPAKNTTAYGTVNASFNKKSKKLDFTITWYNLSGAPTGAHMHGPAGRGKNAGIAFDFFSAFPSTPSGTFTTSTTADGTNVNADSLLAGKYYLNIHTAASPAGEIRAQIEF